MQPITLEALEVLDAIDRKGSFAAAADILYRVPSAITYTVQKLEQDLGITLFIKEGRRSVLTPAGRLLMEQGREILQATSYLAEAVRQMDSGWETALNISVDSALGIDHVYPVLDQLFALHADIEINLYEETLAGCWEALVEKRTDIAIGYLPPHKMDAIESRFYGELPWAFVVGKDHPLTQLPQPINKEDTECYRAVVVRDSVRNSAAVTKRLFSKKPVLRVPTVWDKIQAQKAGLGIGYLPLAQIQHELARGELIPLQISGVENNTPIYVSWWRDNKGKALQWFIEKLSESKL
jgi:DNA-binding transcriptional LysR family regulator